MTTDCRTILRKTQDSLQSMLSMTAASKEKLKLEYSLNYDLKHREAIVAVVTLTVEP